MANQAHVFRSFLFALLKNAPLPLSSVRCLRNKAQAVIKHVALKTPGDLANDVVGELLLGLASDRDDLQQLVVLPDNKLCAAIWTRLRQIVVESRPTWRMLKTLRAHVCRALLETASGPVESVESLPDSVLVNDKLSYERIRVAILHLAKTNPDLSSKEPGVPEVEQQRSCVRRVSAHLMRHYVLAPEHYSIPAEGELGFKELFHPGVEEYSLDEHDSATRQRMIDRTLTHIERQVLASRVRGLGLEQIAASQGISTTSVHKQCKKAAHKVQRHVTNHHLDPQYTDRLLKRFADSVPA